jgi:diacylglycerol kinase family enzyme
LGATRGLEGIRTIEAIVNPKSGKCTPQTAAELVGIFKELGREANVVSLGGDDMEQVLQEAAARKPDLVVILAGDGTARAAAEVFGPKGPLIAPLPGGTMNMLPKALYGENTDWRVALREAVDHGVERHVGGGVLGGHTFYVAAMIGATALFAPAREAAREGRLGLALQKAAIAYRRAFAGRVRFELDSGVKTKAQSLTLMCPMISKVLSEEDRWMEAAAIDPHGPGEALRIGARVALSRVIGDWRDDPAVEVGKTRRGRVWASFSLPALLDGEPVRLGRQATFEFRPNAFRALAPHTEPEEKV